MATAKKKKTAAKKAPKTPKKTTKKAGKETPDKAPKPEKEAQSTPEPQEEETPSSAEPETQSALMANTMADVAHAEPPVQTRGPEDKVSEYPPISEGCPRCRENRTVFITRMKTPDWRAVKCRACGWEGRVGR